MPSSPPLRWQLRTRLGGRYEDISFPHSQTMSANRIAAILALPLALTATVSLLFISRINSSQQGGIGSSLNRQLSIYGYGYGLARFFDPKSVVPREASATAADDYGGDVPSRRTNCQIVYVLGVEGSIQNLFTPVIRSLAERQVDPLTGTPYNVIKGHDGLRSAIFGSNDLRQNSPPLDDPQLVRSTVDQMCPPPAESWRRRVIIEGNSFPSGSTNNKKLQYRVRRQSHWLRMTSQQIASDEAALNHPTNLYKFYDAFSQYVDVRFVVLHRPYLETIATHMNFDSRPEMHSKIIMGYLILLSRFLKGHLYAAQTLTDTDVATSGSVPNVPLWTIVCAEKLSSSQYDTQQQLFAAREHIIGHLADFLGWPQRSCPLCFDEWKESSKKSPVESMGEETSKVLLGHADRLDGIWPPRREEDVFSEQQCRM